jgi:hypothetical protein
MKGKKNRAISIIEYCAIIGIVVAALIGIEIYFKRAICGRWRQAADIFGFGRQARATNPMLWEK